MTHEEFLSGLREFGIREVRRDPSGLRILFDFLDSGDGREGTVPAELLVNDAGVDLMVPYHDGVQAASVFVELHEEHLTAAAWCEGQQDDPDVKTVLLWDAALTVQHAADPPLPVVYEVVPTEHGCSFEPKPHCGVREFTDPQEALRVAFGSHDEMDVKKRWWGPTGYGELRINMDCVRELSRGNTVRIERPGGCHWLVRRVKRAPAPVGAQAG